MARIFVSYRRQDATPHAVALKEELERRFGGGSVFVDTDSIGYGGHFPAAIERAMDEADTCLVLIGPGWLPPAGNDGRRPWRDDDWVRREVKMALDAQSQGRIRVIPVLIRPVRMPGANELPEDIRRVQELNGFVLDNVVVDAPRLAQIIERRHSVLEPAIVMALAAGVGLGLRAFQRSLWSGLSPDETGTPGLAVTRWFMELAGTSVYYALLVFGVLLAVRARTGWRTPEMARIVACAALGVAAAYALHTPFRLALDAPWNAVVTVAVWFAGAALGSAIGIQRYAPTLRVSAAQWLRLGVAVVALGAIGSALQGLMQSQIYGVWLRNPRTLLWGPVLLAFAAVWQRDPGRASPSGRPNALAWGIVVPVLLSMLAADAIGVLTGPWVPLRSPAGRLLGDIKDAWNGAIFFGMVAAVTAWRLNGRTSAAPP